MLSHLRERLGSFVVREQPAIELLVLGRGDLLHGKADFRVLAGIDVVTVRAFEFRVTVCVERHRDHQARKLAVKLVNCRADETVELPAMVAGVVKQAPDPVRGIRRAEQRQARGVERKGASRNQKRFSFARRGRFRGNGRHGRSGRLRLDSRRRRWSWFWRRLGLGD